jgi:hypothetical protein
VIGMAMGHDQQRQLRAAIFCHLSDGILNAAGVFMMHAAVDQNELVAAGRRHGHQEEVAETHAEHTHAKSRRRTSRPRRIPGASRWWRPSRCVPFRSFPGLDRLCFSRP